MDNDAYGHLNNVVYYSLFDTIVNGVLIEAGALDILRGDVIGFVVETHCNYFLPLAFPQPLEGGLRVARIGETSVRYEIGIFAAGAEQTAARGHFVHVYVDRATQRPVALSMAGGYGREVAATVQVQVNTLGLALESWQRWNNEPS